MIRNRLLLVYFLNFLTFLSSVFSMMYYPWLKIEIAIHRNKIEVDKASCWANLLYGKLPRGDYQTFFEIGE